MRYISRVFHFSLSYPATSRGPGGPGLPPGPLVHPAGPAGPLVHPAGPGLPWVLEGPPGPGAPMAPEDPGDLPAPAPVGSGAPKDLPGQDLAGPWVPMVLPGPAGGAGAGGGGAGPSAGLLAALEAAIWALWYILQCATSNSRSFLSTAWHSLHLTVSSLAPFPPLASTSITSPFLTSGFALSLVRSINLVSGLAAPAVVSLCVWVL